MNQRRLADFKEQAFRRIKTSPEQALLYYKSSKKESLKGIEKHQENVAGVFAINRKKSLNTLISQYPHILLFDDLWLTGATLKTCAQVLKRNKIKKVWALTLAR